VRGWPSEYRQLAVTLTKYQAGADDRSVDEPDFTDRSCECLDQRSASRVLAGS
jgi:hypothetical protein